MSQYALSLHKTWPAQIKSVTAEQFAALKQNPAEPDVLYLVDEVLFIRSGDTWTNVPIVSSAPPNDDDGMPDGTIYIQIAS